MTSILRTFVVVSLGFILLVLQSTIATLVNVHWVTPQVVLPIVIWQSISSDVHLVRGAFASFALGYLADSFCGNLMSLHTFVMVATFTVVRGAGLRLFFRGPAYQVVLTFAVGVLALGTMLALRAIFEKLPPFSTEGQWSPFWGLLADVSVTAFLAPLCFSAVRRADTLVNRRKEESAPG
ncbi:MAG: hypothetical protein AAF355_13050 [Myxococcota bacterium]